MFSESYKKLFVKTFREDWCSNSKTKQKYQEVHRNETKSSLPTGKKPFGGSLQYQAKKDGGGDHDMRISLDQRHTAIP